MARLRDFFNVCHGEKKKKKREIKAAAKLSSLSKSPIVRRHLQISNLN